MGTHNAAFELANDIAIGTATTESLETIVDGLPKILTTDNTAAYTPTADYHPATKGYVDGVSGSGIIINVMNYGAVGDGVTDDYSAVQDAMDAATAGDTVYLPAGTYLFDATWVAIPTGVKVIGAGIGATIIMRGSTASCLRVSTHLKDNGYGHSGYDSDKENIEIAHMTMNFNSLANGWEGGKRLIEIKSSGSDAIRNLHIHHIHIADNDNTVTPAGAPVETLDSWGIENAPLGSVNENIKITDCIHDAVYRQFIGGGQAAINGYWVERNYLYHCRDNGISILSNDNDVGPHKNIFVRDNRIEGFALGGISLGADGGSKCKDSYFQGVTISGNVIIGDSFKETVTSDNYQAGIVITANAGGGVKGLNITGNTIYQQSDSTCNNFYSIYLESYTGMESLTLDSTFVQPAEDATVGSLTFSGEPAAIVGSIMHFGDSGVENTPAGTGHWGGRYEVTIAGEPYTIKRLPWMASSATGLTVPVTGKLVGEVKDAVVVGNTVNGQMRFEWCVNLLVADNICSTIDETDSMYFDNCYDIDVKDNTLHEGRMNLVQSNHGRIVGNTFGLTPTSAGWIRIQGNPDDLSRETHNELYLSHNTNKIAFDGAADLEFYFTTSSSGTYSVRGNITNARTPEGNIAAEIGTTCLDTTAGVLYVKTIDATSAGWAQVSGGTTETVTTGSPALMVSGSTSLDSSGGAITGTLGSGAYVGQQKTIVMTEASTSSTISITKHETSDPEVATFDAVDEYWLGMWTGTEWVTVSNTCTFV